MSYPRSLGAVSYTETSLLAAAKDWKRTFSIYWRDYQDDFLRLLEGFDLHARHLDLLAQHQHKQHVQEYSSQQTDHFLRYEDDREVFRQFLYRYEDDRTKLLSQAAMQEEERRQDQYSKVQRWLSNPGDDEQTYQARWRDERDRFPGTSIWILENSQVKDWMDKEEPSNSILWVYGKKGAGTWTKTIYSTICVLILSRIPGKTILASRIIDHLIEEKTESTTSFFYCREDDLNESSKCMSLYKSLLRQLVEHNRDDLLPLYYDKKLKGQEILNNEAIARSLLELCFERDTTHFIVIDGLDEFSAQDRSSAIQFISSIVDKSDKKSPTLGKIRVLFFSQDLKEMRKLVASPQLSAPDVLEIQPSHVESDIRILVTKQTELLTEKFMLTTEESERVKTMTVAGAKGKALPGFHSSHETN